MDNGLALAEVHRIEQVRMTGPVQALLGQVWNRTIDPTRLDATFPVYLEAAERVLGAGREASHALARRYYMRVASAAGADALELPLAPLNREALAASLQATGPAVVREVLDKGLSLAAAQEAGLAATIAAGKRIMLDGGRQMLVEASRQDPNVQGWARLSDGSPCGFCAMLVSRGPVYGQGTVSFRAHDGCGCGVRLVYRQDKDNGWSPQAGDLEALWERFPNAAEFRAALSLKQGKTQKSFLLGEKDADGVIVPATAESLFGRRLRAVE